MYIYIYIYYRDQNVSEQWFSTRQCAEAEGSYASTLMLAQPLSHHKSFHNEENPTSTLPSVEHTAVVQSHAKPADFGRAWFHQIHPKSFATTKDFRLGI